MVPEEVCTWYETGLVIRVTVTGIHLLGPTKFPAYNQSHTTIFQESLVTMPTCLVYKIYLDRVGPGKYEVSNH